MKVNSLLPLLKLVPALLPPPLLLITCRAMSLRLGCGWARPPRQSRHCTLSVTWWSPGGWLATLVRTHTDVAPDWTAWEKPKELTECEMWQLFCEDATSVTLTCLHGSPTDPANTLLSQTRHNMDFSISTIDTQWFQAMTSCVFVLLAQKQSSLCTSTCRAQTSTVLLFGVRTHEQSSRAKM